MKKKEKIHKLNCHTLYHLTDIINDEENFICNLSDICYDEMIFQVFNILSLIYGPKENIEFITYNDQTLWREKGTDKAQFIVFSDIR